MSDIALETVQELSERIVNAQRDIRILDSIKWDDAIKQDFFKNKAKKLPPVTEEYYQSRPLPFLEEDKIDEFRLIIRDAENKLGQYSPITRLIKRQCEEYIKAVHMLAVRGTPQFSEFAMQLYGSPNDVFYPGGPRLSQMGSVLFEILTVLDVKLQSEADLKVYTPLQAQVILKERLDKFFVDHAEKISVIVSDDMVADAAAGADNIKLSSQVMFSERDLKYLEVHEGWVHLGTTLNGAEQPYCFFLSKGSPSSSILQEGLAVLTEVITFSSYPGRMKKITNRVIALDKIVQGANFLDVYNYFLECDMDEESSYNQSVRIFRGSTPTGGPFTKDLSYAKGFVLIYNFIRFAISQHRIDVIPLLFTGKINLEDLPLVTELHKHDIVTPPLYLPPQFRDMAALSAWLSFSLFLNKFDLAEVQKNFNFLLV